MFGISQSVRSREVQVCTPELFHQAIKGSKVSLICAEIEDALEKLRRGELKKEEYERMKTQLKSQLPILTPHATFKNGRRLNADAIPSGLSIYDKDHIPNPRGYWEKKRKLLAQIWISADGTVVGKGQKADEEVDGKGQKADEEVIGKGQNDADGIVADGKKADGRAVFLDGKDAENETKPEEKNAEDGGLSSNPMSVLDCICLVHVTPSTEGLRLVFVIPKGMNLATAQKWMSIMLDDDDYDTCVKDLARPSFLVPEDYILYINEAKLFKGEERRMKSMGSEERRMKSEEFNGSSSNVSESSPKEQSNSSSLSQNALRVIPQNVADRKTPKKSASESANIKQGGASELKDLTQSGASESEDLKEGGLHRTNNRNSVASDNQGEGFDAPPTLERSGSERRAGAVSPSPLRGEGRGERWSPPSEGGTGWLGKTSETPFPQEYSGIPYATLVTKLVELLGGEPQHGSRNTFIFTLACYLRYLCDDNPAWVKSIIPIFGEEQKRAFTTVESACARKQSHVMPSIVRKAIKLCQDELEQKAKKNFEDADFGDIANPNSYFYHVNELPQKLPRLIKLLVSKTPKMYQPAVSQAVFPPLAAHLCSTRFRYIDNVEHEATLMSILCAPTGSGKECVSEPINHIMADIRMHDAEQRAREKAWKDECNSKGSNKDKRERPEGLVIQEVNIDMTNPAFVLRMKEAEQHFLYAKVNELNLFDALKGKTNQHFRIMELAFDLGMYGQDRVGVQSVTETVRVRFNWNASCTPKKCRDYFRRVVTDGPVSRISFSTIDRRPCGSEIPVYGTYDAAFDEELRPYIDNLVKARGLVDCPQAFRLAQKLVEENAEFARLSQNYVFENLSFRANVIAYLKACVLYVANGMKWEKSIEDFIRWSERYDLWCKLKLFGQMIYDADNEQVKTDREFVTGPKNLLQMLPDEFTLDDYLKVRRQQGFEGDTPKKAMNAIYQWSHRGYVAQMPSSDTDTYSSIFRKLKFLNSKS